MLKYWLFPAALLLYGAAIRDLRAFSLMATGVGLLIAFRLVNGWSGDAAPESAELVAEGAAGAAVARPTGAQLAASLLPHLPLLVAGFFIVRQLYPLAAHDAIQAGDLAYAESLFLTVLGLGAALLSRRWPLQRLAARLLPLGALALLLVGGVMGHGRWATDPIRMGTSLLLFAATFVVEGLLGAEETEPDLAGLLPLFAAAVGLSALHLEAQHLWTAVATEEVLARENGFMTGVTLGGWLIWAGLLALLGRVRRARPLLEMAGYVLGASLLYGLCWFLLP
jgi:hypothetical membrane protein